MIKLYYYALGKKYDAMRMTENEHELRGELVIYTKHEYYTVIHSSHLKGYTRILLTLCKILWLIVNVLFTQVLHKAETDDTDETEKRMSTAGTHQLPSSIQC